MPASTKSAPPDLLTYDWQKFGLTKEGKPVDDVELKKKLVLELQVMHTTVTFSAEHYFAVSSGRDDLSDEFAEKFEQAISNKELSPGFDFGFLLKHHKPITGGWNKEVNRAIALKNWSSWGWPSVYLRTDLRNKLEKYIKEDYTDKGKPFTWEIFMQFLVKRDINASRAFETELGALVSQCTDKYKQTLSNDDKDKLESEAAVLEHFVYALEHDDSTCLIELRI